MFKSFDFDISYPLFSQKNISLVYRNLQFVGRKYLKIMDLGFKLIRTGSSVDEKSAYMKEFIDTAEGYYYLQWLYEKSIDLNIQILNGRPFKDAYLEWEEWTFVKRYKNEIGGKIQGECDKYKNFDEFVSIHLFAEPNKTKLYLEGIKR